MSRLLLTSVAVVCRALQGYLGQRCRRPWHAIARGACRLAVPLVAEGLWEAFQQLPVKQNGLHRSWGVLRRVCDGVPKLAPRARS